MYLICKNRYRRNYGTNFCKQPEAEYTVVGLDIVEMIMEEDGGMRAYPLFSFDPTRNLEVFYIGFDAGVKQGSFSHVEEYIFLVQGVLKMAIEGKEVIFRERQSICFFANVPPAYHNISDKICTAYNVIFYPVN